MSPTPPDESPPPKADPAAAADPARWTRWLRLESAPPLDPDLVINRVASPLGPLLAVADDEQLLLLEFCDRRALESQLRKLVRRRRALPQAGANRVLETTQDQLAEYFAGSRQRFSVALGPVGTPFQQRAWQALRQIPYGDLSTYRDQARRLGAPAAVRAVGSANGANPVSILIPCHRLVGSNGELTGYGGGLWRKQYLIDLEAGRQPSPVPRRTVRK